MRGCIVAFLAWMLCLSLAAYEVRSVRAIDTSKSSSRVEVELSGAAKYSVQPLNNGEGVRLTVSNAGSVASAPVYQRLSEIIYSITTQSDGQKSFIDIQTMGKVDYSLSTNSAKDKITLALTKAGSAPAKAVNKPKIVPEQKKAPLPAPEKVTEAKPDTLVKPVIKDTLNSSPEGTLAVKETEEVTQSKPNIKPLILWSGIGLLLLLIVFVFWKYFRKTPQVTKKEKAEKAFEGPTLMLDSETRTRMVRKLTEQGWTAREIAREMKMNTKDVETLLATIKRGGNER